MCTEGAANIFLYSIPYTLSKPYTEFNTIIGSVVGAIPPVSDVYLLICLCLSGMCVFDVYFVMYIQMLRHECGGM